jgi:hypothetical protein
VISNILLPQSSSDFNGVFRPKVDPGGRAVYGVRSRPLTCWDCGFESRPGKGCLSLVNVVCCQIEVPSSGRSPVQRNPTECGVSECDREASILRRPWSTRTVEPRKKFWLNGKSRITCIIVVSAKSVLFLISIWGGRF